MTAVRRLTPTNNGLLTRVQSLLNRVIEDYPNESSLDMQKIKNLLENPKLSKQEQDKIRDLMREKVGLAFEPVLSKIEVPSGIHLHRKLIKIACKTVLAIKKIDNDIPTEDFIIENYTQKKDPYGRNILMTLWDSDLEALIPKSILQSNYLLEKDNYGSTCIHIAAIHQKLDKIPLEVRTKSNLISITDKEGNTVIHRAILGLNGILDSPNKRILSAKTLLTKNKVNITPMDILLENFDETRDKKNLKYLCKLLPTSSLSKLSRKYKNNLIQKILSKEIIVRTIKQLEKEEIEA
jgi:hypothetical protein